MSSSSLTTMNAEKDSSTTSSSSSSSSPAIASAADENQSRSLYSPDSHFLRRRCQDRDDHNKDNQDDKDVTINWRPEDGVGKLRNRPRKRVDRMRFLLPGVFRRRCQRCDRHGRPVQPCLFQQRRCVVLTELFLVILGLHLSLGYATDGGGGYSFAGDQGGGANRSNNNSTIDGVQSTLGSQQQPKQQQDPAFSSFHFKPQSSQLPDGKKKRSVDISDDGSVVVVDEITTTQKRAGAVPESLLFADSAAFLRRQDPTCNKNKNNISSHDSSSLSPPSFSCNNLLNLLPPLIYDSEKAKQEAWKPDYGEIEDLEEVLNLETYGIYGYDDDDDDDDDDDVEYEYDAEKYDPIVALLLERHLERQTMKALEEMDVFPDGLEYYYLNNEDIDPHQQCRRNQWQTMYFPNCNSFHEMTLHRPIDTTHQQYQVQYRGNGSFRMGFLLSFTQTKTAATSSSAAASFSSSAIKSKKRKYEDHDDGSDDDDDGHDSDSDSDDDNDGEDSLRYDPAEAMLNHDVNNFVWKSLRYHLDFNLQSFYMMHMEAIIFERLSASPRIIDIYGHCGASTWAEHMVHEVSPDILPGWPEPVDLQDYDIEDVGYITQEELDKIQINDVVPFNNLTLTQKLDYAIVMAESIADIHGFEGGVILHGDIHPIQWLKSTTGQIKLNDFNNGEIMEFHVGEQEYCDSTRCYPSGAFRPPEELDCEEDKGTEQIDVYAMGNILYTLLTGLWPYYQLGHETNERIAEQKVIEGELPHVDARYRTRSLVESGLVKIMEQCWEYNPNDRPSIFDVVRRLYEIRDQFKEQMEEQEQKSQ